MTIHFTRMKKHSFTFMVVSFLNSNHFDTEQSNILPHQAKNEWADILPNDAGPTKVTIDEAKDLQFVLARDEMNHINKLQYNKK